MPVLTPDLLETALKHLRCSGQVSLPFPRTGLRTDETVVKTPGSHRIAEMGRTAVVALGQPTKLAFWKGSADMKRGEELLWSGWGGVAETLSPFRGERK